MRSHEGVTVWQSSRLLSYKQILNQGLHILSSLRGGGIMGCQLDESCKEVLALLYILLHFLLGQKH